MSPSNHLQTPAAINGTLDGNTAKEWKEAKTQSGIQNVEVSSGVSKPCPKEAALHRNGLISAIVILIMYYYGNTIVASSMQLDDRQNDWLLMKSPLPILLVTMLFIFIVTVLGPRFMRGREPIKGLKKYMIMYNAVQVVFSGYIFYLMIVGGWNGSYSLRCEPCDYSNDPMAVTMLHGAYWYFFSKFVDFFDTFFFVLNKKYEHVSLLHVIHHSIMPVNTYFVIRYMPGGHSTFIGLLNSFVHVVMYFYYGVSALGPQYRKYLWWKKYLTKMQITQFIAVLSHNAQLAFIDCPIPSAMTRWLGGTTVIFLVLFSDFYVKAYIQQKKKREIAKQAKQESLQKSDENTTIIKDGMTHSKTISRGVSKTKTELDGLVRTR